MKNVCLISYSKSPNYGAALQLYATYKVIERLGCNVKVVDYHNRYENPDSLCGILLSSNPVKEKARIIVSSYIFGVKKNNAHNFERFYSENIRYTNKVNSASDLNKLDNTDVFCVGSDQVWNPAITDGFDEVFCLKGVTGAKKISYASSMGSINLSNDYSKLFEALVGFDALSAREQQACDLLSKHCKKDVFRAVDPTIMYGRNAWDRDLQHFHQTRTGIDGQYVLMYVLGGMFDECYKIASEIARKTGSKIALISTSKRKRPVDFLINNADPFSFVELIKNARCVVTNSFHGTCFSVIYGKPFFSVKFGANPARAEELLTMYGLNDRLITDGLDDTLLNNDDVQQTQDRVLKSGMVSEAWLEDAILSV